MLTVFLGLRAGAIQQPFCTGMPELNETLCYQVLFIFNTKELKKDL